MQSKRRMARARARMRVGACVARTHRQGSAVAVAGRDAREFTRLVAGCARFLLLLLSLLLMVVVMGGGAAAAAAPRAARVWPPGAAARRRPGGRASVHGHAHALNLVHLRMVGGQGGLTGDGGVRAGEWGRVGKRVGQSGSEAGRTGR